jgi:phage shock protein C
MSRRHRHRWGCEGRRRDRDDRTAESVFESPNPHRLYRAREDRWVGGVVGGLAEYTGIRAFPLRLATIASLFFFGPVTVLAYVIAMMVLRKAPPRETEMPREDRQFWRTVANEPKTTVSTLGHRFRDMERRLAAMEATVATPEFDLNRKIRDLDR